MATTKIKKKISKTKKKIIPIKPEIILQADHNKKIDHHMDILKSLGSEFDEKRETLLENQMKSLGMIQGITDSMGMLDSIIGEFKKHSLYEKDKKTQEFFNTFVAACFKRFSSYKEQSASVTFTLKGKKDAVEELVKDIENKYLELEKKKETSNIGVHPDNKPNLSKQDRENIV